MKEMPLYDVTEIEQELIDQIPVAVKTGNTEYIIEKLTALYKDEEFQDCLSAMMIIEKYLFRAYELLYFVEGKGLEFDLEEYFFDEGVHNSVINGAKEKLDKETAKRNYGAAVMLASMGMGGTQNRVFGGAPAEFLLKDSALGGSIDGAYSYGAFLSDNEEGQLLSAFWYWVAANQGHAVACEELALCFQNGKGVCADEMTTIYWLLRSFISGNSETMRVVADLLMQGYGIPDQELLGSHIYSLSEDLHNMENYKSLMDIAFELCEYLEEYIYNRYMEE